MKGRYVERVFQDHLGKTVTEVNRFPMGLSHYVFDVVTEDKPGYVIRLARPERKAELENGLYWQKKLEEIGIPLPKLFHTGEVEGYFFVIHERLPGADLEEVYGLLSTEIRKGIAQAVADIQRMVHDLDDPWFENALKWPDVLEVILNRSEREIIAVGLCDRHYVDLIRGRIHQYGDYLTKVESVPFLYDTSVRNIIVHNERVSGIVDVDEVWFGDPLLMIGRGKTLLLLMQEDTDYITYWCEYLGLSDFQLKIVDLYALLYCIRFMGTMGQTLNGNPSIQTNAENIGLLESAARELSGVLDSPLC
jgi:aminoglycoside phosphotransferase (APT) family kinase protein